MVRGVLPRRSAVAGFGAVAHRWGTNPREGTTMIEMLTNVSLVLGMCVMVLCAVVPIVTARA